MGKSIAVLMAAYNGEKYIRGQLDSLLNQTVADFEIYICDDGSSDDTRSIVKTYEEKYPDRIRFLQGPGHQGATGNFLYLLFAVESDYYMYCDQDDIWFSDKIEKTWTALKEAEEENGQMPTLVFCDSEIVNEQLETVAPSFTEFSKLSPDDTRLCKLIMQNSAAGSCCIFNKKVRDEALKFRHPEVIQFHDWWTMIAAAASGQVIYFNEPLMQYRQHANNELGAGGERGAAWRRHLVKKAGRFMYSMKENRERTEWCVRHASELAYTDIRRPADAEMIRDLQQYFTLQKAEKIRLFKKYQLTRGKRDFWTYWCM